MGGICARCRIAIYLIVEGYTSLTRGCLTSRVISIELVVSSVQVNLDYHAIDYYDYFP